MASRQGGMEISYIDAESKVAVSRSVGGSLIDQHSLSLNEAIFFKRKREHSLVDLITLQFHC